MTLLGLRTAAGDWTWILRSTEGVTLAQSARTFKSYALAMIDASWVCDHLQTAHIECSDYIPILPMPDLRQAR